MVMWPFIFICVCAVIGFTVDLGTVYLEKARLQSAVDAASLAGAVEIGKNSSTWQRTAQSIGNMDGTQSTDYSYTSKDGISYNSTAGTVTATVTRSVPLYFMKLFGIPSVPVTVSATATTPTNSATSSPSSPFYYAIYSSADSGQSNTGITFNVTSLTVTGTLNSNSSLQMNVSHASVSGMCAAANKVTVSNGSQPTQVCNGVATGANYPQVSPPSSLPTAIQQATPISNNQNSPNYWQKYLGTTPGLSPSTPVYSNGWGWSNGANGVLQYWGNANGAPATVNGPLEVGDGTAEEDVMLGGNATITINGILYVPYGNVTINSSCNLNGVIYAPRGVVTLNGTTFNLNGGIVAEAIIANANTVNLTVDSSYLGGNGNGMKLVQ